MATGTSWYDDGRTASAAAEHDAAAAQRYAAAASASNWRTRRAHAALVTVPVNGCSSYPVSSQQSKSQGQKGRRQEQQGLSLAGPQLHTSGADLSLEGSREESWCCSCDSRLRSRRATANADPCTANHADRTRRTIRQEWPCSSREWPAGRWTKRHARTAGSAGHGSAFWRP